MERLLARLERTVGRHVPDGLPLWLIGLSALGYLVTFAKPEVYPLLLLDPRAIAQGEAWRIVTFLFAPLGVVRQPLDLLWVAFGLQLLYSFMTGLEAQWGAFRFLAYWLIGAIGTAIAALIVGGGTALYLDLSIVLAFATLFPDYQIVIFFILPVKMRWVGILAGVWLVYGLITGDTQTRAAEIAGLVNYLLFCGPALVAALRGKARETQRARARTVTAGSYVDPPRKMRVCAKCGKSEADDRNLEFRVCDCQERCKGRLTEYCLEHARNH